MYKILLSLKNQKKTNSAGKHSKMISSVPSKNDSFSMNLVILLDGGSKKLQGRRQRKFGGFKIY